MGNCAFYHENKRKGAHVIVPAQTVDEEISPSSYNLEIVFDEKSQIERRAHKG
jgi:hypothetical protein